MTNRDFDKNFPANAPTPGLYQHYKGQRYQVLGMARHSETEEWLVLYQALYGERGFWTRPLSIWLEPVKRTDVQDPAPGSDALASVRFQLIESSELTLDQLTKPAKADSG